MLPAPAQAGGQPAAVAAKQTEPTNADGTNGAAEEEVRVDMPARASAGEGGAAVEASGKGERGDTELNLPFKPVTLTFSDLRYYVPNPSGEGELQLLKGIYGVFRPGVLTALMGASGAGKTTLMDVRSHTRSTSLVQHRSETPRVAALRCTRLSCAAMLISLARVHCGSGCRCSKVVIVSLTHRDWCRCSRTARRQDA